MKIKRIAIVICVLLIIVVGYFAYRIISGGRSLYEECANLSTNERTSDEVLTEWLENDKNFDVGKFCTKYMVEDITIDSTQDEHTIPGCYIYAPGNVDKSGDTVIMVHGLLGNRIANYPMTQMFLNMGINVITYDQRSSGGNMAPHTTFGYLESYDTIDYIAYARDNMSNNAKLGVWGQSMGAATVENAMDNEEYKQNVNYTILDSPLGNMEDIMRGSGILNRLQLKYADTLFQKELGFSYKDQNVYSQIADTKIPVMIVASKGDQRIPYELQMKIYDIVRENNKRLYTVKDSDHSDIYFDHPEDYQKELEEFLKMVK